MNSQIALLNWPTRGATVRVEGASGGCFLHCQTQVLSEVVVIPCTYILATPKPVAGTLLQKGTTPPTLLPTATAVVCSLTPACQISQECLYLADTNLHPQWLQRKSVNKQFLAFQCLAVEKGNSKEIEMAGDCHLTSPTTWCSWVPVPVSSKSSQK